MLEVDEVGEETSGPHIYPKDVVNHLLVVWAIDYVANSPTKFNDGLDPKKPADAVVVDVVDLDQLGEDGQLGLLGRRSWWRQGRLIQKLKPRVGRPNPIVIRITKDNTPNSAFNPVDVSTDPSCMARVQQWYSTHSDFKVSSAFEAPPETRPAAPASPLEQAAAAALKPGQSATMANLQQMADLGRFQGEPPF